ncbi:arsenate reductase ArsC [Caminibacter sp.]
MKILVMCTGNSCRSIIAEAILKDEGFDVKSCGSSPSGGVNENAKKVLKEKGKWRDEFYSKSIDEVINKDFDLVITVCDNAKESCPVFPKKTEVIHIPFEDPDGKEYEEFVKTYDLIKEKLLPIVKDISKDYK